jgi:Glycosyl hydrolases family 16
MKPLKTLFFPFFLLFFCFAFFIQKTNAQPRIHYGFLSEIGRKPQWIMGGFAYNKMKIEVTEKKVNSTFEKKIATEFNLIFEENFEADTINTEKWCISVHNDDRPCDGFNESGGTGDINKPGLNPKNVTVKNGICSIAVTNESNGFCNYSGGELKTFSVLPNHTFKDYNFQKNAYIEMRVQIPFGAGVGSSAWLYSAMGGHYNEIDIWETLGNDPYQFQSTYIQQVGYDTINKHAINWLDVLRIHFYNTKNKKQSLDNQWITIGLEWSDTAIIWYANGQKMRHLSLNKIPPCMFEWVVRDAFGAVFMSRPKTLCQYKPYLPPEPFTFRIGTAYGCIAPDCGKGSNQLKYAKLPVEMKIDYIKVYQKKGAKAALFNNLNTIKKIKNADNVTFERQYLLYSYLPEVKYEWSSNDFKLEPTEAPNIIAFTPSSDLEINQLCAITCTATFPSGYVEKSVKTIRIVE